MTSIMVKAMTSFFQRSAICLLSVLFLSGCGTGKDDVSPERLAKMAGGKLNQVVPVSGAVLIDGTATAGVNVYLYKEGETNPVNECRTDKQGKYCWAMYTQCDGVEPGAYRLGFEYVPKAKRNGKGPDEFKGKYRNPLKNDFKLTVEPNKPQKDVNYELKLK